MRKSVPLSPGFSLIEILVVIGVTTIITGVFIAYSSGSREVLALSLEKAKVAQLILRAKSFALSTKTETGVFICGYGLLVDETSETFTLFRYEGDRAECAAAESNLLNPSLVRIIESHILGPSVRFDQRVLRGNELESVLFIPPEPTAVIVAGGDVTAGAAVIYLRGVGSAARKAAITVSPNGQVSF